MKKDRSKTIAPVTPGELLNEEFLLPMSITKYRLAKEIGVPPQRIGDIVSGKRSISADTDLRLCKFFGLSSGYWLRAQIRYDSLITMEKIKDQLEKIRPIAQKTAV
jgi:addiction module HigA family antidote